VSTASAYSDAWQRPPGAPAPALAATKTSRARRLVRLALFLGIGFSVGIGAALTVPAALGMHPFTVLSGSMEPTLAVGDVVVEAPLAPRDARVGDVITFRSPQNQARLVTHRVVRVRASGDSVWFQTKGDANTGTERWSIEADGVLGRVEYRVPKVGYVTNRLGSRFGRLGLIVIPALLLGLYELKRIWRPKNP
jgi:signal peptidase I